MHRVTKAKADVLLHTYVSNDSIIPPSFKFTELHALTLAACSYGALGVLCNQNSILPKYSTLIYVSPKFWSWLSNIQLVAVVKNKLMKKYSMNGGVLTFSNW